MVSKNTLDYQREKFLKTYRVNEIFYSIQGEGIRAGSPNVFVRFSGCNLTCRLETHGFDCDTEFASGLEFGLDELVREIVEVAGSCRWVIFTGGEPALQLDDALVEGLKQKGFSLAIETNGTKELPKGLDWVCVSPKTAEHTLRVRSANEIKYVRSKGQGIPKPLTKADHKLISPAFHGGALLREDLEWCVKLVKDNPEWRLSVQYHHFLGCR